MKQNIAEDYEIFEALKSKSPEILERNYFFHNEKPYDTGNRRTKDP